jgi:hypothetical protein
MVYLTCARAAGSAATRSVPAFRLAGRAGQLASLLSAQAAAAAGRRALATVPAYADFVGPVPPRAAAADWLAALPVADKKSYIDAYPLAARCRHGVLPAGGAELDESSGSSGRPYTWIRSAAEAVTGMAAPSPGRCSAAVDSSAAAVTARSVASRTRVRRAGRA